MGIGARQVAAVVALVAAGAFGGFLAAPNVDRTGSANASPTSPEAVAEAVEHIRLEMRGIRGQMRGRSEWHRVDRAYPKALAVLNHVVGRVSAPAYSALSEDGLATADDPDDILARGAGICGGAMIAYKAIADQLGLRSRYVYIRYPNRRDAGKKQRPGHATIEVWWDGQWHWLDPTWGIFYRKPKAEPDDLYGVADVMRLGRRARKSAEVRDRIHLWHQTVLAGGDATVADMPVLDLPRVLVVLSDERVIYSRGGGR